MCIESTRRPIIQIKIVRFIIVKRDKTFASSIRVYVQEEYRPT